MKLSIRCLWIWELNSLKYKYFAASFGGKLKERMTFICMFEAIKERPYLLHGCIDKHDINVYQIKLKLDFPETSLGLRVRF